LPFGRFRAGERATKQGFFSLNVTGYALNPITSVSLSDFSGIPLERQAGFGRAVTNRRGTTDFCSDTVVT